MNETQWKHRLQYARDHYPPGTRIRLLAMPDDPQPIPPGTTGTVMGVDDILPGKFSLAFLFDKEGCVLNTDDFWNLLDQMPHQSSKARHKPAER